MAATKTPKARKPISRPAAPPPTSTEVYEEAEVQKKVERAVAAQTSDVLADLAKTSAAIVGEFANIGTEIQTKKALLTDLTTAISASETRLSDLHKIDATMTKVADAQRAYEQAVAEMGVKQEELRQQNEQEREALEIERQREKEEYDYNTQQERRRSEDDFNANVIERQRAETARQRVLEENWTTREKALAAREKELTDLKTTVDGFETRLKSEVKQAEAILRNSLEREYNHAKALAEQTAASKLALSDSRITSLQETIASQARTIEGLKSDITSAREDAKSVATKALESAAGRQLNEVLTSVVNTQNQNTTPGKQGR